MIDFEFDAKRNAIDQSGREPKHFIKKLEGIWTISEVFKPRNKASHRPVHLTNMSIGVGWREGRLHGTPSFTPLVAIREDQSISGKRAHGLASNDGW